MDAPTFVYAADIITAAYLQVNPTGFPGAYVGVTNGLGDVTLTKVNSYGVNRKVWNLQDLFLGNVPQDNASFTPSPADPTNLHNVLEPIRAALPSLSGQGQNGTLFRPLLQALAAACAASSLGGVTDINSFATYYNAGVGGAAGGSPQKCLLPPDFAALMSSAINITILPGNIYAPPITAGNGMGRLATGPAFTAGAVINPANYAGAAYLQVVVTGMTGSDILTITGTNQLAASKTWEVNLNAGNGTYAVPANGGGGTASFADLLCTVTGMSVGAGITVIGEMVVQALIPQSPPGRVSPPV